MWGLFTNPTAHALASWHCGLWGRHKGAQGVGGLCLWKGCPGLGRSPSSDCSSFGRAVGARCPFSFDAGVASVGIPHKPHSARS